MMLSRKFGLNPSLGVCFYCGDENGEVVIPGLLRSKKDGQDVEAPRRAVWHKEPCARCQGFMAEGIIMISVDESKSDDQQNPYRTGGWVVLKEEALRRIGLQPPELEAAVLRQRVCFIADDAWDRLGLPRPEASTP